MPQINLYRKINSEYMDKRHASVSIDSPVLSYCDIDGEKIEAQVEKNEEGAIEVNKLLPDWFPNGCDLEYHQEFHIGNPGAFFGNHSVTDKENKIGLAVHVSSRTSMFQETIPLDYEIEDTPQDIKLNFTKKFKRDELRGEVKIGFFFYLKSVKKIHQFQADRPGMTLSDGNFFETCLIVDGSGSAFPITETEIPCGPLWQMRKHWDDPCIDPFNASSVEVELNSIHPIFKQLVGSVDKNSGTGKALMESIIKQAIAMIIFEAVSEMNNTDGDSWNFDMAAKGSVLEIVGYWVDVYEIDIDNLSMINVFDSVQKNVVINNRKAE